MTRRWRSKTEHLSGDQEKETTTNDSLLSSLQYFSDSTNDSKEYFSAHLFGKLFCSSITISKEILDLYFIFFVAQLFWFLIGA